jgi:hypothetical protein
LTVGAGTFDTILVEPELKFDGVMKKGRVQIWFSDDPAHIPVKIKTRITVIGAITINLADYHPGNETPK